MKNLKFALLSFVFLFLSCNNEDDHNIVATPESSAARIYLNSVKQASSPLNQDTNDPIEMCFSLVFPVNVIYNNGDEVTINSMEGLKQAIYSENFTFHINSIVYPFSIINESNSNELQVETEDQFLDLLASCDINMIDDLFNSPFCFEFVFPFSIIKNDGSIQAISSLTNLNDILASMPPNEYWIDFMYPFQISYGNDTISIENIWELYDYLDCTPENSCSIACTADFNPVCVATSNGIILFSNSCWAQCAGFTEDDFVNCD